LFHEISGAMASMRGSIAAEIHWTPPAYEPPAIPIFGSPGAFSAIAGFGTSSVSMSAFTSRASHSSESTSAWPPDWPNPRWSQVSTA
jgi:hypothetical protein